MKKVLVWLAVILACGILLSIYVLPKIRAKSAGGANSLTDIGTKESSPLETWVGKYSFSEYAPPNQNMFYSITIYSEDGNYYAKISNNGFQTLQRLLAKVSGDPHSIDLKFLEYLPDNVYEPYKEGDILLSFGKEGSKLTTTWGKIQPLLTANSEAGEYFELSFSN